MPKPTPPALDPEIDEHRTSKSSGPAPAIEAQSKTARLARFVLAHRRIVIVGWLVIFLAGAIGASHVSKRLSVDFSLPGQPGYETARKIQHIYGNGGIAVPAVDQWSDRPRRADRPRVSRPRSPAAFARVRARRAAACACSTTRAPATRT